MNKKLSILFDLTPYSLESFSGSGRAIFNLLEELFILDKTNQYFVFSFEESLKEKLKFPKNFKYVYLKRKKLFGPFSREIARRRFVYRTCKQNKIDIVHFNLDPYNAGSKAVSINFLHDVMHLNPRFKKYTKTGIRVKLRAYLRCLIAKRSDYLLVNSNYTKTEVCTRLKIKPEKVKVISFGVEKHFSNGEINYKILENYNINGKYILFVGRYGSQKNELLVLKSFLTLLEKKAISDELTLVMVGDMKNLTKQFIVYLNKSSKKKHVNFINYISDEDLAQIYRGSSLFIFPSYEEGFGLPVLEAMSCGTPIITSNVSSLVEVTGDAGILVSPWNQSEIESGICNLLKNNGLRKKLISAGYKQASKYSYSKGAEQILDLYNNILKSKNS